MPFLERIILLNDRLKELDYIAAQGALLYTVHFNDAVISQNERNFYFLLREGL